MNVRPPICGVVCCMPCVLVYYLKMALSNFAVVGTPPGFMANGEPQDTIVHTNFLQNLEDTLVNLILNCRVTGDPTPVITWYRGDVDVTAQGVPTSSGSLGLNVTEGSGASRAGILYHCQATNTLGSEDTFNATIRSRDANVSYACECNISIEGSISHSKDECL